MLDQAEANVRAALNSREPRRRDGMARFVLQRAGREYGTQKHAERLRELGTVRLVWSDGKPVGTQASEG